MPKWELYGLGKVLGVLIVLARHLAMTVWPFEAFLGQVETDTMNRFLLGSASDAQVVGGRNGCEAY